MLECVDFQGQAERSSRVCLSSVDDDDHQLADGQHGVSDSRERQSVARRVTKSSRGRWDARSDTMSVAVVPSQAELETTWGC